MRRATTKSLFLVCTFVCSVSLSWSLPSFGNEQEHLFESSRFWGRGGTYVAAFDSDEATRANPATLAEAEKLRFQMRYLQFDGFVGKNTLDTVNDLNSMNSSNAGVDFLKSFREKFGKRQFARLQLAPLAVRVKSFEFSPFAVSNSFLDIRTPTVPEMRAQTDNYAGANFSYGRLFGKSLALGVTVRPLYRWYLAADLNMSDMSDYLGRDDVKLEDFAPMQTGSGIGADVGATWSASKSFRLGLVVQNIGDTGSLQHAGSEPPPFEQKVGIGSLWRLNLGQWRCDFSADVQDALNREKTSYWRLLHLGGELGTSYFSRDLDAGLQAGVNEGYVVAGMFVDILFVRIDLASYTVELGEYPGQRHDDRWAFSMRSTTTF